MGESGVIGVGENDVFCDQAPDVVDAPAHKVLSESAVSQST
jgi:hypothetical protein